MEINAEIAAVLDRHPPEARERLLALRRLILAVAAATLGVGKLEETLKWGQISYLTAETKSGTTVRIDRHPAGAAVFVNCRSDLLARYRAEYPANFRYEGDRAIVLDDRPLDEAALRHCVAMALTYKRR